MAQVSHLGELATAPPIAAGAFGRASRIAAQSIPNVATTIIKLDTLESEDPGKHFDLVNGWYVVPATGAYWVAGQVAILFTGALTEGEFIVMIYRNGGEVLRGSRIPVAKGLNVGGGQVTGLLQLTAGDHLELAAYQFSGAERTLEISSLENCLSVARVA